MMRVVVGGIIQNVPTATALGGIIIPTFLTTHMGMSPCGGQAAIGLKKIFFFAIAFHLLRVVLAFKQNKVFERIIIISPYPSEELLYIPTLLGHMFPQPTLKGNSP